MCTQQSFALTREYNPQTSRNFYLAEKKNWERQKLVNTKGGNDYVDAFPKVDEEKMKKALSALSRKRKKHAAVMDDEKPFEKLEDEENLSEGKKSPKKKLEKEATTVPNEEQEVNEKKDPFAENSESDTQSLEEDISDGEDLFGEKAEKHSDASATPEVDDDDSSTIEGPAARWFFWNEHNQWQVYSGTDSDAVERAFQQGKVRKTF